MSVLRRILLHEPPDPCLGSRPCQAGEESFWDVIVKAKWGLANEETTFDFKYVPEYNTLTELGKHEERKLKRSGIESRNLKTFVVFAGVSCVALSAGMYATVKVAARIVGTMW